WRPEKGKALRRLGGAFLGWLGAQRAAVGDSAPGEVVGGDGDGDGITRQDADEILANSARNVRDDLVTVLQADAELRVGQRRRHFPLNLKGFFFRHTVSPISFSRAHRERPGGRQKSRPRRHLTSLRLSAASLDGGVKGGRQRPYYFIIDETTIPGCKKRQGS